MTALFNRCYKLAEDYDMRSSKSLLTFPIKLQTVFAVGVLTILTTPAWSAGAPIPVIPVDMAAPSQPVSVQALFSFTAGVAVFPVYIVPAGKRFVIETVSATSETLSDAPNAFSAVILINSGNTFIAFPAMPSGSLTTGTANVRLYADPGSTVSARLFARSTVNDQVGVGLSGYLVDAPLTPSATASTSPSTSVQGYSGMATKP